MTIVFRSRALDHTRTGSSIRNIRRSGTDWSHLRLYDNDDIRDIAWSQSTGEKIYVRERSDQWWVNIISVFIYGGFDDFFIENIVESKRYYLETAEKIIRKSASEGQYHLRCLKGGKLGDVLDDLLSLNTSWNLILIFRSFSWYFDTPVSIKKLSYVNDMVMIDLYHPFDIHPSKNLMIQGKITWISKRLWYEDNLAQMIFQEKKSIIQKWISYLQINTSEDIETCLNYFFKKRYTHE